MTTSEAKQKLLLYRGSIDDPDPQFQEALAHVRRDPELAEWLQEPAVNLSALRAARTPPGWFRSG